MISCVCLTIPGRTEFLKRSIDCFRRQTFHDRELVIVADDGVRDIERMVSDLHSQARVLGTGKLTVATKRNIGCEHSRGDVIAVWDDDDYSAPHRLAEQSALLQSTGKAVTALYRIYLNDSDPRLDMNHPGQRWWLSLPGWVDTSLMFKRSWWAAHKFTDQLPQPDGSFQTTMLAQDGMFMHEANRFGEFHLGGEPRWMFFTNHPGNVCAATEPTARTCMYPPENALKNFVWTDK